MMLKVFLHKGKFNAPKWCIKHIRVYQLAKLVLTICAHNMSTFYVFQHLNNLPDVVCRRVSQMDDKDIERQTEDFWEDWGYMANL